MNRVLLFAIVLGIVGSIVACVSPSYSLPQGCDDEDYPSSENTGANWACATLVPTRVAATPQPTATVVAQVSANPFIMDNGFRSGASSSILSSYAFLNDNSGMRVSNSTSALYNAQNQCVVAAICGYNYNPSTGVAREGVKGVESSGRTSGNSSATLTGVLGQSIIPSAGSGGGFVNSGVNQAQMRGVACQVITEPGSGTTAQGAACFYAINPTYNGTTPTNTYSFYSEPSAGRLRVASTSTSTTPSANAISTDGGIGLTDRISFGGTTDTAPGDTVTIVAWLNVYVNGVLYKWPLYQ